MTLKSLYASSKNVIKCLYTLLIIHSGIFKGSIRPILKDIPPTLKIMTWYSDLQFDFLFFLL